MEVSGIRLQDMESLASLPARKLDATKVEEDNEWSRNSCCSSPEQLLGPMGMSQSKVTQHATRTNVSL